MHQTQNRNLGQSEQYSSPLITEVVRKNDLHTALSSKFPIHQFQEFESIRGKVESYGRGVQYFTFTLSYQRLCSTRQDGIPRRVSRLSAQLRGNVVPGLVVVWSYFF